MLQIIQAVNCHLKIKFIFNPTLLLKREKCRGYVESEMTNSIARDNLFDSVNVPRARIHNASIRWMPMTRSHDPFPRRHSSHETLDAYVNGRRVVTILPADNCVTRTISERK